MQICDLHIVIRQFFFHNLQNNSLASSSFKEFENLTFPALQVSRLTKCLLSAHLHVIERLLYPFYLQVKVMDNTLFIMREALRHNLLRLTKVAVRCIVVLFQDIAAVTIALR